MRKELLVYVNTNERGQEISVASLAADRNYVVINTSTGKVGVAVKELKAALEAISVFNAENNTSEEKEVEQLPVFGEIVYGEE